MKPSLRIAVICEAWYPLWGGGQVHVKELAQRLALRHHHVVDIFVLNLGEFSRSSINPSVIDTPNITLHRVGPPGSFTTTHRVLGIGRILRAIRRAHKKAPYDLIHAHSNLPAIPAKVLQRTIKIPVVFTVHGANFLERGKKNVMYYLEKFLLTKIRFDRQITVSKQFLIFPNVNKPVYIPNGIDVDRFATKLPLDTRTNRRKIIFVGRLDPIKGLATLMQAAVLVRSELRQLNVQLHLIGQGPQAAWLRQQTRINNIDDVVILRGPLYGHELDNEYLSARVFVLPSHSEGLPLTLLEAMAAKLPLISTRVGDIPSLITDGVEGFLVPPRDAVALAQALLRALHHPHLTALGEASYRRVRQHYDWDKIADETAKLYAELAHH